MAWLGPVVGLSGGPREDTGGKIIRAGAHDRWGRGGKILVTRCHGFGADAEVARWVRGAEGPGTREAGAPGRFSGDSGDALVLV